MHNYNINRTLLEIDFATRDTTTGDIGKESNDDSEDNTGQDSTLVVGITGDWREIEESSTTLEFDEKLKVLSNVLDNAESTVEAAPGVTEMLIWQLQGDGGVFGKRVA